VDAPITAVSEEGGLVFITVTSGTTRYKFLPPPPGQIVGCSEEDLKPGDKIRVVFNNAVPYSNVGHIEKIASATRVELISAALVSVLEGRLLAVDKRHADVVCRISRNNRMYELWPGMPPGATGWNVAYQRKWERTLLNATTGSHVRFKCTGLKFRSEQQLTLPTDAPYSANCFEVEVLLRGQDHH
jgi:hypothetical protein